MSTPFTIAGFEEYLATVRDELPNGRVYFRGQGQLVKTGFELKPSIGRYKKLASLSLYEREQMERQMLGTFPDLDGIAKWLKYRVLETDGKC